MTLNELLKELSISTREIPKELGNLTVENESKFCRYALKNYMESKKFLNDLEACHNNYNLIKTFSHYFLIFKRHTDQSFSIYLAFFVLN